MIKKLPLYFIIIAFAALFSSSCEQERNPCFEPKINALRFTTYQVLEGDTGIVVSDSALPSALLIAVDSNKAYLHE